MLASGAVDPLARLGQALAEAGYAFVTPTPETHRRVLARGGEARTLRDVFGWSRPFDRDALPQRLFDLLEEADAVESAGSLLRSFRT